MALGSQLNVPQMATQVLRKAFTGEVEPNSLLAKWTSKDNAQSLHKRDLAAEHLDAAIKIQVCCIEDLLLSSNFSALVAI